MGCGPGGSGRGPAADSWSDAGRGFSVRRPFAAGVARRGMLCGRVLAAGVAGRCCVAGRSPRGGWKTDPIWLAGAVVGAGLAARANAAVYSMGLVDFVWLAVRRGGGWSVSYGWPLAAGRVEGRSDMAGRGGCRCETGRPGKCSGSFYGAGRFCVAGCSPRGWLVDVVWLVACRGDWSMSYAGTVRIDCRPLVGGLPSGRFRGTIGRLTFAGIFGARARGFRPGAEVFGSAGRAESLHVGPGAEVFGRERDWIPPGAGILDP